MKTHYRYSFVSISAVAVLTLCTFFGWQSASAEDGSAEINALVQAVSKSKVTLLDGIKQATQGTAIPISAKFELEDGKLSLSVYTAGKGLSVPAEDNVLQELSGSPEPAWVPQVEVFKDVPHVARSSEQLTLMSLGHASLAKLVAQVQKKHAGKVFSITPAIRNHRPVAVILLEEKGKVRTLTQAL